MSRDSRAHDGHRLTAEKLSKKLETVRRVGATVLYLHERDVDDAVIREVFLEPSARPLKHVTSLQLQSNPRLTSAGVSAIAQVADVLLPSLTKLYLLYTGVDDLRPLAKIRSLEEIDATVERPMYASALTALPKLKRLTISNTVTPEDLAALRARPRLKVWVVEFAKIPPRFP